MNHLYPIFLFIAPLAFASLNFIEKKTRWSTVVEGETELQLAQRIFVPLPEGFNYDRYRPTSGIGIIPKDLWHEIAGRLDPLGIWNLGLTCKYYGGMVRDNRNGLFYIFQHPDIFRYVIWNSDLTLYHHMTDMMAGMLNGFYMRHGGCVPWPGNHWRALKKMFCLRAGDLEITAIPTLMLDRMSIEDLMSESFGAHLYRGLGKGTGYCYLPPVGVKLFDCIDAREIAQLIKTLPFKSAFAYPLLMDYIIPSFHKQAILTNSELKALRYINTAAMKSFEPYFECLNWAIYFLTGATRVNSFCSKSLRVPIQGHLEYLGLAWEDVCNRKTFSGVNPEKEKDKLPMMPAILLAAKQWGLDWVAIAQKTAEWAPICRDILNGTIPKYLTDDITLSLPEIVKIFTGNFVEKLYWHEGELLTASSLQSQGIKRPSTTNNDKRPMKRVKLENSCLAGPLTCVRTIEENVKQLVDSGIGTYQVVEITQTILKLCELLNGELQPVEIQVDGGEREDEKMALEFEVSPHWDMTMPTRIMGIPLEMMIPPAAPMAPVPAAPVGMGFPMPIGMAQAMGIAPAPVPMGVAPAPMGMAPMGMVGPAPAAVMPAVMGDIPEYDPFDLDLD